MIAEWCVLAAVIRKLKLACFIDSDAEAATFFGRVVDWKKVKYLQL